jgi:GNAT superfamily N-acetyltransferase
MLEVEYFQNQALVYDDEIYKISHPDGISVTLRSLRKSDVVLIMEMHDRLSNESVYYRYLGANKPTIKDFQHLCSSDGEAGMAIVATVEEPHEKVIALAYYLVDPDDPSTAEPAVLVEDSFQGCGLGKQIVIALYQMAIQEGLTSFDTFIHPANYRVLQMIKSSGLQVECKYCDGMKKIRIWL